MDFEKLLTFASIVIVAWVFLSAFHRKVMNKGIKRVAGKLPTLAPAASAANSGSASALVFNTKVPASERHAVVINRVVACLASSTAPAIHDADGVAITPIMRVVQENQKKAAKAKALALSRRSASRASASDNVDDEQLSVMLMSDQVSMSGHNCLDVSLPDFGRH